MRKNFTFYLNSCFSFPSDPLPHIQKKQVPLIHNHVLTQVPYLCASLIFIPYINLSEITCWKQICKICPTFAFQHKINKFNPEVLAHYWIISFDFVDICYIFIANRFFNFFSNVSNVKAMKVCCIITIIFKQSYPVSSYRFILIKIY